MNADNVRGQFTSTTSKHISYNILYGRRPMNEHGTRIILLPKTITPRWINGITRTIRRGNGQNDSEQYYIMFGNK